MDELEIQGKKYISSKRASELTGYAKDYVGQLARAGKIPGTRVGRAWYVDEGALRALAGPADAPQRTVATPQDGTVYSIHALNHVRNKNAFGTWSSVVYFDDSGPLIPPLSTVVEPVMSAEKTIKMLVFPGIMSETQVRNLPKKLLHVSTDGIIRSSNRTAAALPASVRSGYAGWCVVGILMAVSILILAGSFNPSEWVFSAPRTIAAVQDSGAGDAFRDYFSSLSTHGAELISSFLGQILSSFWSFFGSGLIFILKLLHLG